MSNGQPPKNYSLKTLLVALLVVAAMLAVGHELRCYKVTGDLAERIGC